MWKNSKRWLQGFENHFPFIAFHMKKLIKYIFIKASNKLKTLQEINGHCQLILHGWVKMKTGTDSWFKENRQAKNNPTQSFFMSFQDGVKEKFQLVTVT